MLSSLIPTILMKNSEKDRKIMANCSVPEQAAHL